LSQPSSAPISRLELNNGILINLENPAPLANLEYFKMMDEEKMQVRQLPCQWPVPFW